MQPSEAIRIFGGVARWNEIECLVTRDDVDAELATDTISRLRRGTYARATSRRSVPARRRSRPPCPT